MNERNGVRSKWKKSYVETRKGKPMEGEHFCTCLSSTVYLVISVYQIGYGYKTKLYIHSNIPKGYDVASFYITHREGTEPSFALVTGPLPG